MLNRKKLLLAFVAGLVIIAVSAIAKRNLEPYILPVPTSPLAFNSEGWKGQRLGRWPERGAFRAQMRSDACRQVNGMPLTSLLLELGPPDWLGPAKDIERGKAEKPLLGNCVLAYFLDPAGQRWLCISVYPDSNFEACFERSVDDGH